MLGLYQAQEPRSSQRERLTSQEKAQQQAVSYYPLTIESRGTYSVARRPSQCVSRGSKASSAQLKRSKSLKVSKNLDFTFIDSTIDQKRYQLIRKRLETCLLLGEKKHLKCPLKIPYNLLNKVSQDVLRMSKSDPSGIEGCVVNVELMETDKTLHPIGQIAFDARTLPSTELTLRLSQDPSSSSEALSTRIQRFVDRVISHSKHPLRVSPGFQIVRERRPRNASSLRDSEGESSNDSSDSSLSSRESDLSSGFDGCIRMT